MARNREFEIVKHTKMNLLEIFFVEMTARSPHGHDDLEIGILLEGNLTLFIEQEHHVLRTGDIYIINRYQVHSFANPAARTATKRNRILAFQVHTDLYRKINPQLMYLHLENNIIRSGSLYQNLKSTLLSCASCYFSSAPFRELKCSSLLFEALHQILTSAQCTISSEQASASAQNATLRLNRITDYLAQHYAEHISLADIADLEQITPCHASHFIKQTIGISFQDYLNQIRFEHALQLMDTTDLTILDICLETGFSSSRYLQRAFEKNLGCTPKEYRKAEKKPRLIGPALPTDNVQRRFSFEQSAALLKQYVPI